MEKYKILLKSSVLKDLDKIPKKDVKRIMKIISILADNPRPTKAKKLSGQERYRIRQGSYRILYSIEDKQLIVYIVKVAHRREVYQNKF